MRSVAPILTAALALSTLVFTGATLDYYEEALPTTMNPLFAKSMVDRRTHELIFDRLFYWSSITSEIKSRLVEEFNLADDKMSVTLTLKAGVKWHDGQPLTAEDVCFTVNTMLNPAVPSQMAKPYRDTLRGCIVDGEKATIGFSRPFHNPRERLSFPVLPAHAFEGDTNVMPNHEFSARPIGTGPMKGSRGSRQVKLTAMASVSHQPKIGVMQLAGGDGDPLIQIQTLIQNKVQGIISVAPRFRPDVTSTDDIFLKRYDLRSWWFAAMNTSRGVLVSKQMRQALNLIIDREELRRLTMGYDPDDIEQPCEFISGPFVPASPYYNKRVPVSTTAKLDEAKALMAASGATNVGGVWTKDGKQIVLRIGMNASLDQEATDLLSQLGNQLQAAGIGRQVYKVSNAEWSTKAVTGKLTDYDILIGKWSFGVVEDVSPLFETRQGGKGALNIFNYTEPKVDGLIAEFDRAKTESEAGSAFSKLHSTLAEELPYMFLWKLDTKSAWRREVKGSTITPYFYFTEFDKWAY